MNKVFRSVNIWRRNMPVAGISTNNQLFAAATENVTKSGGNSKRFAIIGLAGIVGGIAFAYYEYNLTGKVMVDHVVVEADKKTDEKKSVK